MIIITDPITEKRYCDQYRPIKEGFSQLSELCIDSGLSKTLIYCDIEGLLTDGAGTWYMLDECGRWDYLPSHYKVEIVKE